MQNILTSIKIAIIRKLIFLFFLLYIVQLILGCLFIYIFYLFETKSYLNTFIQRVENDIKYNNGSWDMSEYNADPSVPGRFRLYVISTDGFVVDRWRPISGFLDNANYKHLLTYSSPQTVETVTNQTWRVYSKPLTDKYKNIIGLINVAIYNPYLKDETEVEEIDNKLQDTVVAIEKKLIIKNQTIIVDNIDIRNIPFDVPFQIVDQYNTVLMKDSNTNTMGRIPSFIDPSYLSDYLHEDMLKQLPNKKHTDTFLIKSHPLFDKNNNPYGIIVAATTIEIMYDLIKLYALISGFVGLILTSIFGIALTRSLSTAGKILIDENKTLPAKNLTIIQFSKKDCTMELNDEKIIFTYASNQYYLCVALFSSPRKKWEIDELLEAFGEQHTTGGWRKIYDAASSINKKVQQIIHTKLIITNNKTFQINPVLIEKIKFLP